MEDSNLSSSFENQNISTSAELDFTKLKPVKSGGSTCDTYVATLRHRKVFLMAELKTESLLYHINDSDRSDNVVLKITQKLRRLET